MKKKLKIPRILKINEVNGFKIYVTFSNGEFRIIDFNLLFKLWKTDASNIEFQLTNKSTFSKVELIDQTLCWPSLKKKFKISSNEEFEVPYSVDPIVLYENSILDEKRNQIYQFGEMIKAERKSQGLTQEELARRSGTTKNYISRIENNKSGIEFSTLIKIIEIGLGRKFEYGIR